MSRLTGPGSSGTLFVAHDRVAGRVRLRAPALKARAALGPFLESRLRAHAGVRAVQVNAITGSVLVQFDPKRVTLDQLRQWTVSAIGDGGIGAGRGAPEKGEPSSVDHTDASPQSVSPTRLRTGDGIAAPAAVVARRQQAAAGLSLTSNLFLVVIKIGAGIASGSISVLAEGVQSTMDVVASALILLTVRAAAAPPDPSHPYGHGKFENIASLGQMILILGSAAYLLAAAWGRWQAPILPRVDWGVAALATALGVDALVSRWLLRVAKETHSQALEAEALHLRSDMWACVGVLGGLAAVALTGEPRLDPLVAAVMTGVVAVNAVRLLRTTLRPLLDESLPPEEQALVERVLNADARVQGYHRLRTRLAGSQRLMDVHILLDDHLTFRAAHAVGEEVEHAIRRALPNVDVTVHAEPFEEEIHHQREYHGLLLSPGIQTGPGHPRDPRGEATK
jgi:cation diffusion facilitator family transporter